MFFHVSYFIPGYISNEKKIEDRNKTTSKTKKLLLLMGKNVIILESRRPFYDRKLRSHKENG